MMMHRRCLAIAALLVFVAPAANGQGSVVTLAEVKPFMGTWVFTMTDPPHFKGSIQTVRVWDEGGRVAASVQVATFPASNVTGMYRDSDMLVLTISREATSPIRENGVALRAVIMLTPDGDGMRMALMLDESETIKRGIGKKL